MMTTVIPFALMVLLGLFGVVMIAQAIDMFRGLEANKRQTAEMNRNAVLTYRKIYGYGAKVPIVHAGTAGRIFLGTMFLISGIIGFVLTVLLFVNIF